QRRRFRLTMRLPDRYDNSPHALLLRHGAMLATCIGHSIDATWVAWDAGDDSWFSEEPVVLRIAGVVLGVNCRKLDEVALCWNAIARDAPPACVAEWGREFVLHWRSEGLADLSACVGKTISRINVVEYLARSTVVFSREDPAAVGTTSEAWL